MLEIRDHCAELRFIDTGVVVRNVHTDRVQVVADLNLDCPQDAGVKDVRNTWLVRHLLKLVSDRWC